MQKPKSEAAEYPLNEEDVKKIIDATRTNRDKIIIELLAFTGCRREELCLLRIMDIKMEHDVIMMPTVKQEKALPQPKRTKSKEEKKKFKAQRIKIAYDYRRRVPIINSNLRRDLLSYIQQLKKERRVISTDRLIWSKKAESISEVQINNIVADCAERANVTSPNPKRKHVHPHMFRHTFVRYAKKFGLDYKLISQIVGHTNLSTTMDMYGDLTWDEKVTEAKKMEEFGN